LASRAEVTSQVLQTLEADAKRAADLLRQARGTGDEGDEKDDDGNKRDAQEMPAEWIPFWRSLPHPPQKPGICMTMNDDELPSPPWLVAIILLMRLSINGC